MSSTSNTVVYAKWIGGEEPEAPIDGTKDDKNRALPWIIVGSVVGALGIGGGVAFFLLKKKKEEQ